MEQPAPQPQLVEQAPKKSPGLKVIIDPTRFSRAINAGANGIREQGKRSALALGEPVGVGGVVKEVVPITGIADSYFDKAGHPGDLGYQTEAFIRLQEPDWVDADALAKLLIDQRLGATVLNDSEGGSVVVISTGDQEFQLGLGYKDAATAKQAITERGEAALLGKGDSRSIDEYEEILSGKEPKPNPAFVLKSKEKPVYGPKSQSEMAAEIASGIGRNPSDMELNVSAFAECLGAVVNGLNGIKGGPSIEKTITLEPPVFFESKPLPFQSKPLIQAA